VDSWEEFDNKGFEKETQERGKEHKASYKD
jgi:hypothetical protein